MTSSSLGAVVHSFFVDHLIAMKGVRPASVRSYRDVFRLFLGFVAADSGCKITRLAVEDLTFERVLAFLRHLEEKRGNHIRTRNHRLAALRTFFEYLAGRAPEMLHVCQKVAAIPTKRTPPPETRFLERDDVAALFARLPSSGPHALRDRVLLLFLYNTGARVQEVADLRVDHIDLGVHGRVRLHGKGDKWRTCPLWDETARMVRLLLAQCRHPPAPDAPVFRSHSGSSLTRFGIYKIVRRHALLIEPDTSSHGPCRISPHVFRHTAAMHLLEAGVEVNVIRGWLGHVDIATTNRYAEINIRSKEEALRACEPQPSTFGACPTRPIWRNDETLLDWLASL